MRFLIASLLLVVATLVQATPIPFNDIERRWSEGLSEVCDPSQPGCYVYAWAKSLVRRKQIHNAHDIREATPAWNVARSADAEPESNGFTHSTDERTMQENSKQRSPLIKFLKREDKLALKMKGFVKDFMAKKGKLDVQIAKDVDEAPVLRPKKGMEYHFTS